MDFDSTGWDSRAFQLQIPKDAANDGVFFVFKPNVIYRRPRFLKSAIFLLPDFANCLTMSGLRLLVLFVVVVLVPVILVVLLLLCNRPPGR